MARDVALDVLEEMRIRELSLRGSYPVPIWARAANGALVRSHGSSICPLKSEELLSWFLSEFSAIPTKRFRFGKLVSRFHRCTACRECQVCSAFRSIGKPTFDHLEFFRSMEGEYIIASHAYDVDVHRLAEVCGRFGVEYMVFSGQSWYYPDRCHLVVLRG